MENKKRYLMIVLIIAMSIFIFSCEQGIKSNDECTGANCPDVVLKEGCRPECVLDEKECQNNVIKICVEDEEGCKVWDEGIPCDNGCVDGENLCTVKVQYKDSCYSGRNIAGVECGNDIDADGVPNNEDVCTDYDAASGESEFIASKVIVTGKPAYFDECYDKDDYTLIEMICENNKVQSKPVICKPGCSAGACMKPITSPTGTVSSTSSTTTTVSSTTTSSTTTTTFRSGVQTIPIKSGQLSGTPATQTCFDYDAKETKPAYVLGDVSYQGQYYRDLCDGKILTEWTCESGKLKSTYVTCAVACISGACSDMLAPAGDRDADGILDIEDNCPYMQNKDQVDEDGDKIGKYCDSDDKPKAAVLCTDSDKGHQTDSYSYISGIATNGTVSKSDRCVENNLVETGCDKQGNVVEITYPCKYSKCNVNKCDPVPCTDEDNSEFDGVLTKTIPQGIGRTYFAKGLIDNYEPGDDVYGHNWEDFCSDDNTGLWEGICQIEGKAYMTVTCAYGCYDGACKKSPDIPCPTCGCKSNDYNGNIFVKGTTNGLTDSCTNADYVTGTSADYVKQNICTGEKNPYLGGGTTFVRISPCPYKGCKDGACAYPDFKCDGNGNVIGDGVNYGAFACDNYFENSKYHYCDGNNVAREGICKLGCRNGYGCKDETVTKLGVSCYDDDPTNDMYNIIGHIYQNGYVVPYLTDSCRVTGTDYYSWVEVAQGGCEEDGAVSTTYTECPSGKCEGGKCLPCVGTCPTTADPGCTNDCNSGYSCSGSYLLTCGNYDTDTCKEWSPSTSKDSRSCEFGCYNAACRTGPCIDSDGENEKTLGWVDSTVSYGSTTRTYDYCYSDTVLMENVCKGNVADYVSKTCVNGCSGRVCK